MCSMSGYYGSKHFKKNYVIFYFIYEIFSLAGKFWLFGVLLNMGNVLPYRMVMLVLAIIINIWILEITVKFIDMIRKLHDTQIRNFKKIRICSNISVLLKIISN